MTLQGTEEDSLKEPKWVYNQTGKYPVLVGLDFMHQTGKGEEWYYNDSRFSGMVVRDASDWYDRGGIPALCWHWRDPSLETNAFYSPSSGNSATDFDIRTAVDPSGSNYNNVLRDIDSIAEQLKLLKDKGVAVLWRPLHEAAGGWFWWGYHGAEPLKKLWKIMFDRFVNYHELNNLIWVWTADANDEALDWYPGDDVVDVIGVDIYANPGDHNAQSDAFKKLTTLFNGRKILTFSECGSIPDPDDMVKTSATWSYFMTWYGTYTLDNNYNNPDYWKQVMSNSFVITLDSKGKW